MIINDYSKNKSKNVGRNGLATSSGETPVGCHTTSSGESKRPMTSKDVNSLVLLYMPIAKNRVPQSVLIMIICSNNILNCSEIKSHASIIWFPYPPPKGYESLLVRPHFFCARDNNSLFCKRFGSPVGKGRG